MKDQNTPDKISILKKTMWQNIILRSKHYIDRQSMKRHCFLVADDWSDKLALFLEKQSAL